MRATFSHGADIWNGGEIYGPPDRNCLQLLKRYFTKYPEDAGKAVSSIKGGIDLKKHAPDGTEAGVRKSVANCL